MQGDQGGVTCRSIPISLSPGADRDAEGKVGHHVNGGYGGGPFPGLHRRDEQAKGCRKGSSKTHPAQDLPGCHKRETPRQDPAEDPGSAGAGRKDGAAPVRGRAAPTSTATATLAPEGAASAGQPRHPCLVQSARDGATVSYDPNCRPGLSPDVASARLQAEEFVAASDIVKASDEDLMWLYPDAAPGESLAAWLELRWQP